MTIYLDKLRDQMELNKDKIINDSLENQLREMSKVFEDLSVLKLVLQSVIFEEKLIIEGSKRKVELYCLGGGHTPSDTFMYLPEEKIAFMGDLVTEKLHLPIFNPEEFRNILETVKEMNVETIVPGHGNVGGKELFTQLLDTYRF